MLKANTAPNSFVFVVLVNVWIFCLFYLEFGSEHNIYCFMKVHNLSVPILLVVCYLVPWVYLYLKFLMRNQINCQLGLFLLIHTLQNTPSPVFV